MCENIKISFVVWKTFVFPMKIICGQKHPMLMNKCTVLQVSHPGSVLIPEPNGGDSNPSETSFSGWLLPQILAGPKHWVGLVHVPGEAAAGSNRLKSVLNCFKMEMESVFLIILWCVNAVPSLTSGCWETGWEFCAVTESEHLGPVLSHSRLHWHGCHCYLAYFGKR